MDAGRRHETAGSETKEFITHSTAGGMSFMFVSLPLAVRSRVGNVEGPGVDSAHPAGLCYS